MNAFVEWRSIPGYEGYYEASSDGLIRGVERVIKRRCGNYIKASKLIAQTRHKKTGYMQVMLCKDGVQKRIHVHKLIALAFIGLNPDALEINHKDYDKTNNMSSNLEYMTRTENIQYSIAAGRIDKRGEKHHGAHLTSEQVLAIRAAAASGVARKTLVSQYGVGRTQIDRIINRTRWGHLPDVELRIVAA